MPEPQARPCLSVDHISTRQTREIPYQQSAKPFDIRAVSSIPPMKKKPSPGIEYSESDTDKGSLSEEEDNGIEVAKSVECRPNLARNRSIKEDSVCALQRRSSRRDNKYSASSNHRRRRRRWHGTPRGHKPKTTAYLLRRRPSLSDVDTPFEAHLQQIYDGKHNEEHGIQFFQSHGYYDVHEANTVELFRQNFGLDLFWESQDINLEEKRARTCSQEKFMTRMKDALLQNHPESMEKNVVRKLHSESDLIGMEMERGTMIVETFCLFAASEQMLSSSPIHEEGIHMNSDMDDEEDKERTRSHYRREKLQILSYEIDIEERIALADEEVRAQEAITKIHHEKHWFIKCFDQAFNAEQTASSSGCTAAAPVPEREESGSIQEEWNQHPVPIPPFAITMKLPPFEGTLYILKNDIPLVLRSWRKRWFQLDFSEGKIYLFKRSYWKSLRGVVELLHVARVARMNRYDLQLEFTNSSEQSAMLLRTGNVDEANLWANLIQYARRQVRSLLPSGTPSLENEGSCHTTMSLLSLVSRRTCLNAQSSRSLNGEDRGQNNYSLSSQMEEHLTRISAPVASAWNVYMQPLSRKEEKRKKYGNKFFKFRWSSTKKSDLESSKSVSQIREPLQAYETENKKFWPALMERVSKNLT
uniref:Uncharacterized protein AlNc14C109G6327 n=1 Tax=Albugo laibachii Nc14 TaxID=890382 RepID=F0WIC6_9STRA|nr:conserved hypothetical protein [Albugo laibachii Nc14]|eukprot:CCA21007.1 conserved hypothetical protein [Albugo laibachii Nc14]